MDFSIIEGLTDEEINELYNNNVMNDGIYMGYCVCYQTGFKYCGQHAGTTYNICIIGQQSWSYADCANECVKIGGHVWNFAILSIDNYPYCASKGWDKDTCDYFDLGRCSHCR